MFSDAGVIRDPFFLQKLLTLSRWEEAYGLCLPQEDISFLLSVAGDIK